MSSMLLSACKILYAKVNYISATDNFPENLLTHGVKNIHKTINFVGDPQGSVLGPFFYFGLFIN